MGTVGLLLLAKKQRLINKIRPEINKLEIEINFRLSEKIKNMVFRQANE